MTRDTTEFAPRTTATNEVRQQPTAGRTSGRTSGLRGSLLGQSPGLPASGVMDSRGLRPHPPTRPTSDRLTGLRGTMAAPTRTDKETPVTQSSSAPDLCRPEPRPGTAVLAQGHRPLRVGPLDTDLVPLPSIATEKEGEEFDIPVLPEGQQLVLSLLTTWGDQYYVGLTGVEVFTASGERATIREVSTCLLCHPNSYRSIVLRSQLILPTLIFFPNIPETLVWLLIS